jgi:pimeloyl-ACP methyl ester carboxylesterase
MKRAFRLNRRRRVALGVLLAFILSLAGARIYAASGMRGAQVRFDVFDRRGAHADLVVILHGLSGDAERMRSIHVLARRAYPQADILLPEYSAGPLSNTDPRVIVGALDDHIQRLHRVYDYERIVLVGHSMGSLLLRKAFLHGHGAASDIGQVPGSPEGRWVERVDRIVLLAGMNRGWSVGSDGVEQSPMAPGRRLMASLGKRFGRLSGTGRLIRSFERGSPFVADLRVDWVRFARPGAAKQGVRVPTVIQLLGDTDDVVSARDNRDVGIAKDFVFIPVPQTGHSSILDAALPTDRTAGTPEQQRAEKIVAALIGDPGRLRQAYPGHETEDRSVKHVVFVLHGIRDYGDWTGVIESMIRKKAGVAAAEYRFVRSSYGWFPMGGFLLLGQRQKNVRWFMDQYTQAVAQYPDAEISYVGHSNGTYLLASGLRNYGSLRVKRVFFAGSVVPIRFPWSTYMRAERGVPRVRDVMNVVASDDAVVGVFPRFFELLWEFTPLRHTQLVDLGSAGFRGFTEKDINVQYATGGHGAGIDVTESAKVKTIAAFIVYGERENTAAFQEAPAAAGWADGLSRFCWVIWILLVVLLVACGRLFNTTWGAMYRKRLRRHRKARRTRSHFLRWCGRMGWPVYACLILAILHTV